MTEKSIYPQFPFSYIIKNLYWSNLHETGENFEKMAILSSLVALCIIQMQFPDVFPLLSK